MVVEKNLHPIQFAKRVCIDRLTFTLLNETCGALPIWGHGICTLAVFEAKQYFVGVRRCIFINQ